MPNFLEPPSPNRSLSPNFSEMDPKAFERMCRSIVASNDQFFDVSLFGENGQKQFGVDIVALSKAERSVALFSCKCRKTISAAKLLSYADEVLSRYDAYWSTKNVNSLTLISSASMENTKLRDAILSIRQRCLGMGWTFNAWGPDTLQEMLRPHIGLVRQYLGEYYVARMCNGILEPAISPCDQEENRWCVHYVPGSQLVLKRGIVGTLDSRNGHHAECFATPGTAVLGTLDPALMAGFDTTAATWTIPISPEPLRRTQRGFIVIGCVRYYGGLHSRRYDAPARISFNDNPIDRILLRIKPEDHSDFFCHIPSPPDFPRVTPFLECSRIYVWSIPRHYVGASASQEINVGIGSYANWDIDYVGIVFQK